MRALILVVALVSLVLAEPGEKICKISNGEANCCLAFETKTIPPQKACIKVERLEETPGVRLTFKANDKKIAEKDLTAQGVPVCVPIPYTPASICVVADKLVVKKDKKYVKIASSMFVQVMAQKLFKTKLPTMEMTDKKITLSKE